jgi:threonine/homoserine/homoserine lactone efflux protein
MMKEKLRSRKFHVFLIWCVLIVFLAVKNQITPEAVQWFGLVCVVYIGSNAVQKFTMGKNGPGKPAA